MMQTSSIFSLWSTSLVKADIHLIYNRNTTVDYINIVLKFFKPMFQYINVGQFTGIPPLEKADIF